jgi:3-oxoadipate enol-lactonase
MTVPGEAPRIMRLPMATNVRLQGEAAGRRVIFIHGVGSHLESWDGVIGRLGPAVRSLSYDLRGHGESEKVPGPYTMDDFVADLKALAEQLGWTRFDLVGFSLGGLVAQALTLRYPAQVRSLTIVSSVADRTAEEKERVLQRASKLRESGAAAHLGEAVERWFSDAFAAAHPEVIEARKARSMRNDPASYAAAYAVLAGSDFVDRLHEIACPALVMTGEHDVGSTPRMAGTMSARIPDARLKILPGLKHSVLLEAPDLVAETIEQFLKEVLEEA